MSETVFSEALCFQIKTKEREDRLTRLKVDVETRTSAAPLLKRYLHVQLTDDSDSFFLYTLRVDEDDFQSLKANQGLLVDFQSFPQKLVELLTLCLNEEQKEAPKFVLHLLTYDGYSTLNIVETNPFKHLVHLSLKVLPGNDAAIKSFLSSCLRDYKERNEKLKNELHTTESSLKHALQTTEQALTERNTELSSLKIQWESKLSEVQAKNTQAVTNEKEESIKAQALIQQRYQAEKRDLEQAHMKIVKQLEARVYELDQQNKELTESRFVNDASIRDLTSKLTVSEEESNRLRLDLQATRKDNSQLDTELHSREKVINQLQTRVAILEQQLNDKENAVTSSDKALAVEQQRKKQLEEDVQSANSKITRLESNVKTLSDEIFKANEIIRKLQQENKNIHAKMKLRSQIALKQEDVLKEKEKQLDKFEADRKDLLVKEHASSKEAADMKEQLEKTRQELDDSLKKIASNENVISWLNKQLDQVQMSRAGRLPGTSGPAPVPIHSVSLTNSAIPTASISRTTAVDSVSSVTPSNPSHRIPLPTYKSTPIISEEQRPELSPASTRQSHINKENEPAIDAKYLPNDDQNKPATIESRVTSRPGIQPLGTRNPNSPIPTVAQQQQLLPASKPIRISRDAIKPHKALANAYFPLPK